jgi:hypothetical protein
MCACLSTLLLPEKRPKRAAKRVPETNPRDGTSDSARDSATARTPPPPRGAGLAVLFSASHPSLAWTRLARNNGQEVARGNLGGHSTRLGRGSHHTHCDGRRRLGPLVGYSAGIICVGSAPGTDTLNLCAMQDHNRPDYYIAIIVLARDCDP